MREERGIITGGATIGETVTLWGEILGNVIVADGGKFYVRGTICGDVEIQPGGRMHIFGLISGSVTLHHGTKVIHSGAVEGNILNQGGRLFIDPTATVTGKVKTTAGETHSSDIPT